MLNTKEMVNKVLLRGGLLVLVVSERAVAILEPDRARLHFFKLPMNFARRGHIIDHFAERMRLSARAACYQFPGKSGGLLRNMVQSANCGGRQSNHVAQTACALWGMIPRSRTRPSQKRHCAAMDPPPLLSLVRQHRRAQVWRVGT